MPQTRVSSILRKQLDVCGTWNSSIAGRYGNEWSETLAAVQEERIRLAGLISHRIGLEAIPEAIEMMARGEPVMKVMVQPWATDSGMNLQESE